MDQSPLFLAVAGNQKEIVKQLLEQGVADVQSEEICDDVTCPHYTYDSEVQDRPEFVHSLLNFGLKECDDDMVILLLQYEVDVHTRGYRDNSVLHYAMYRQAANAEIFRLLIDRGAEIDARNDDDRTPLIVACKTGNHVAIDILLAAGADIQAQDGFGKTAMGYAIELGHSEIVIMLSGYRI